MSGGCNFKSSMIALSATFAIATGASAESQSQPAPAVFGQPAVSQAAPSSQIVIASLEQDGLHQDARWPLFSNCVNNTASQDEFLTCLRSAFMTDSTGTELALLHPTKVAGLPR